MENTENLDCEARLKIAEARLSAMSDQTSRWLWETDENHVFSFFTANMAMLTGLRESDVLGTSRLDLALSSLDENWQQHGQVLIKHLPFKDFKYTRTSNDGDTRHLGVTGWPLYDDHGNFTGYRGFSWDETEAVNLDIKQIQKEENLLAEIEKQRASLETVLENLSQSVMWFDQFGSIRLNNAQTPKILGFSDQEYARVHNLKQHLRLLAERGDFGEVNVEEEIATRAARLCTELQETEAYRIHLQSNERYLDIKLKPLPDGSRILTHTDVTLEAKKDLELTEREALLSTVISSVDQGILLMDNNLNIEIHNEKFSQLWGLAPDFFDQPKVFDDIMNCNRYSGYYPDVCQDDKTWEQHVNNQKSRIRTGDVKNMELVRGDGKTLILSTVRLPGGKRMTTYFDITELKLRESELELMQNDLAQANELLEDRVEQRTNELRRTQDMLVKNERQALLGDLVSSLCHELRNPLNALNTSLYLIRRNVEGDFPKLTKAFDRSERTIKRCTNILTDLFDYALVEDLKREPVVIAPWLLDAVEVVEIPESFSVVLDIDNELPDCNIDPIQLGGALAKIISNAAQAVADKLNPTANPEIQIYAGDIGDHIEIIISDNGPGMDEDTFSRAMEPLFSTRGFGVGLGLPIAEQIVRRHGGDIRVETREGTGTSVTMWFPVSKNRLLIAA